MSLFTESFGHGPDVVLLHGWGMNGDVWEGVIPILSESYRVTTVDLPGHGRSVDELGDYSLEDLARQVVDVTPRGACVVGWSLGGMVATQMVVNNPGHISKLVLVASAAQFIKDESWPEGMEAEVLDSFAGDLQADYRNTVKRFIAIQAMGSDNAREEQRILRDRVFRHGHPQLVALEGGLKILHNANLRPRLSEIDCPTLLLTGEYDSLFRPSAAKRTKELIDDARLSIIKGAGHAPFLSHQDEFVQVLKAFLGES